MRRRLDLAAQRAWELRAFGVAPTFVVAALFVESLVPNGDLGEDDWEALEAVTHDQGPDGYELIYHMLYETGAWARRADGTIDYLSPDRSARGPRRLAVQR